MCTLRSRVWQWVSLNTMEWHLVFRAGSELQCSATVVAVCPDCDAALLTVENPRFWEETAGVAFGPLPHLRDPVIAAGFPVGGTTYCVTSGVVSRVEVNHAAASLTACDAVQCNPYSELSVCLKRVHGNWQIGTYSSSAMGIKCMSLLHQSMTG